MVYHQFIKMGTKCLFDKEGKVDYERLQQKAVEISQLEGQASLVVSGAIALGKKEEQEERANEQLSNQELRYFAAVGQPRLTEIYAEAFSHARIRVHELLVTNNDLRYGNKSIIQTIDDCLAKDVIALINYDDQRSYEEIRKDNDNLAADLLCLYGSERLIKLGCYAGFMDCKGILVPHINNITPEHYSWCKIKSNEGLGGFEATLDAAQKVLNAGKVMIVGSIYDPLKDVVEGKGTVFSRE
jgi:glutamate 5-kinase